MFPSVARVVLRGLTNSSRRWKVNMLYDSQCPLCMHEVRFLERRNTAGLVRFTDIASPDYNPAENGEVEYERGMKVIHAVLETGEVVEGVAVFRHVYSALGLGWVWALTRLPGLGWAADRLYSFWAGYRPVFSTLIGRATTRLGSHWSRASECCWPQQSCAIKKQHWHPKTKPVAPRWFFMA